MTFIFNLSPKIFQKYYRLQKKIKLKNTNKIQIRRNRKLLIRIHHLKWNKIYRNFKALSK